MISNSVTHLQHYNNTAIKRNFSPILPVTPCDCRAKRRCLLIESWYRSIEWRVFFFYYYWIIELLFWNYDYIFSKMSDIALLWSQITIFIIEITLKQLLHKKYGWNNPNWGGWAWKVQSFTFWSSGSSKFIKIQIYVTGSIFIRIRFFFLKCS